MSKNELEPLEIAVCLPPFADATTLPRDLRTCIKSMAHSITGMCTCVLCNIVCNYVHTALCMLLPGLVVMATDAGMIHG